MTSSVSRIARSVIRLAWPVLDRGSCGDRERRARHRDGRPLQRGGPRRGRDRGSVYFSVFIGLMGVIQALSADCPRSSSAESSSRGSARKRVRRSGSRSAWRPRGPVARVSRALPAALERAAGGRGAHAGYLQGIAWALPAMLLFRVFFRAHDRGVAAARGHV